MSYSLKKKDRLKSKKTIGELFEGRQTIKKGSFILYYNVKKGDKNSIKISFSASKKKLPRAVDRNRMKRLMREAFRFEKPKLLEEIEGENVQLALMLVGLSEKLPKLEEVQEKIKLILSRLIKEIKSVQT
ncbi:MAG: ribonuclease P protein component [Flavobacteriales bacterium]|nr:ribonuclease P protein component [Flavobacteriales bacterium]